MAKPGSALTKITAAAKKIRKDKPKMAWSTAVKQASAEYRKGTLGAVKKSVPKAKVKTVGSVPKRIVSTPVAKRVSGIDKLGIEGKAIIKKIDRMEIQYKTARGAEKELLKNLINGEHYKLDTINRQIKQRR